MSVWSWWRERRRWNAETKNMPHHQLRWNADNKMYDQNPAKQKWAEWKVWRREKLWGHPIGLAGLVVAIVGPIAGVIGRWYGLF